MNMAPYLPEHARSGYRLGNGGLVDAVLRDALVDPAAGCHMGMTAVKLAGARCLRCRYTSFVSPRFVSSSVLPEISP